MRRFYLSRRVDVTGTSGDGLVAEGIEFSDGTVVLRWLSGTPSTVIYHRLDDAIKVHGHDGQTVIVWRDKQ